MISLLSLALAAPVELLEAEVARVPVQVGAVTYTAVEPIYLVPTPVFDKLLTSAKQLKVCDAGLASAAQGLRAVRKEHEVSQLLTLQALGQAGSALSTAQNQMELDARLEQDRMAAMLKAQEKLGRAQAQRNVALGITGGVLAAVLAGALLPQ